MPDCTRRADIISFGIRYLSGSTEITDTPDNWTVDRIQLEILQDPIAQWITEYNDFVESD